MGEILNPFSDTKLKLDPFSDTKPFLTSKQSFLWSLTLTEPFLITLNTFSLWGQAPSLVLKQHFPWCCALSLMLSSFSDNKSFLWYQTLPLTLNRASESKPTLSLVLNPFSVVRCKRIVLRHIVRGVQVRAWMRVNVNYFADTVAAMSTGWLRRVGITKNFQATTTAWRSWRVRLKLWFGLGFWLEKKIENFRIGNIVLLSYTFL